MHELTVQGALVGAKISDHVRDMEALRKRLEAQRDHDPTPEGRAEARHLLEELEESAGTLRWGGLT